MLQSLESLIFQAFIVPLDWVGIVNRISDQKEYHDPAAYQLNSTIQLMLYKTCEFLNDIDLDLIKLLTLGVLCPPLAIFWRFGCGFRFLVAILGIMCGLTPLVVVYTIYCIRYHGLEGHELDELENSDRL